MAYVSRVPRGPVLAVSPFNFPLNLVAHKVAPAIAVGAPVIVKPAPATPLSALILGELLAETDLPAGMFSVLPVPNDRASALVDDERLPILSFTGSDVVGYQLIDQVPRKHVTLELGGIPDRAVLQLPGGPELHLGAAGGRAGRGLRRLRGEAGPGRRGAGHGGPLG
jgi:aldehyde dehydrogenase (NAD+)